MNDTGRNCRSMARPVSGSEIIVFLKRAEDTEHSLDWEVSSSVVGSIQTSLSTPETALNPLKATVPFTERVLHGVEELMPVRRLLAPLPLVMVNATLEVKLVDDAILNDLSVDL